MKPAPFEYHEATTLDEALSVLAEDGEEAKILAGGQSLVPLLNFRLARPERLVDVNGLAALAYVEDDGVALRIGALTRHSDLERLPLVAAGWPLLSAAVGFVGHPQIRNRGTVGGSVAHADPTAELPAAFTALEAQFHIRSADACRTIGVDDFFVTHLTTVLEPDEMLIEIEVPRPPARSGAAFLEFARRNGDFALGGAACVLSLSAQGVCSRALIALLGADATPLRARGAEQALIGHAVDAETAKEVAALAIADIDPPADSHGSRDYRRGLIGVLVQRALREAASRAEGLGP